MLASLLMNTCKCGLCIQEVAQLRVSDAHSQIRAGLWGREKEICKWRKTNGDWIVVGSKKGFEDLGGSGRTYERKCQVQGDLWFNVCLEWPRFCFKVLSTIVTSCARWCAFILPPQGSQNKTEQETGNVAARIRKRSVPTTERTQAAEPAGYVFPLYLLDLFGAHGHLSLLVVPEFLIHELESGWTDGR